MPLPKVVKRQFELILPSTEKTIKFRPFLVKEEKILIEANETRDKIQIMNAMKQILKNCILTKGIKVEELPSFDIEYLFLNVRSRSAGENLDLIVTCEDDGITQVPITIFIDEIQVHKDPEHSRDIVIQDDLILRMKYPSLNQFVETTFSLEQNEESSDKTPKSIKNIDRAFEIIAPCMDVIYNDEDSYAASDCEKEELYEWLDDLTNEQFKKIEKFFQTMPVLKHEIVVTNPKTGVENKVTIQGLSSFFI